MAGTGGYAASGGVGGSSGVAGSDGSAGTGGADAGGSDGMGPDGGGQTVYGSSHGADVATTGALLAPRMIRTYTALQLSDAKTLFPDTPVHHSYLWASGPYLSQLAAADPAQNSTQITYFSAVPDLPGCRVTIAHETDNNLPAVPPATYLSAWATFLSQVVPTVNAGRTHPVTTVAITTGNLYKSGGETDWFVPGADEIGADVYETARLSEVAPFAASKGKPWCLPEYGYSTYTEGTDAQILARMKSDSAIWKGFANPPTHVLWFNNNHNALSGGVYPRPLSAA